MPDEPDLHHGASSEWVTYLQQLLNHYYRQQVVVETGYYDDTTGEAVRHFREQNGLPESTAMDTECWTVLLEVAAG